jgi:outer membrane protein assembly factor BamB
MTRGALQLELQSGNARRSWRRASLRCAGVAAAFCAVVAAILLVTYLRDAWANPLVDNELTAAKARLARSPDDAALQERVRQADSDVRRLYFQRRRFIAHGSYLLLGGLAVMLAALKLAASLGAQPYVPQGARSENESPRWSRAGVALAGGAFVLVWLAMGMATDRRAGKWAGVGQQPAAPVAQAPEPAAAPADFERNWPMLRGPGGSATAAGQGYATDWDGVSGRNIVWKTPVALPGNSSPVVWDDRVYLTGATAEQREVYCFDAASGSLRWKQPVPKAAGPAMKELSDQEGYANSTAVTDGRCVAALFPDGQLACLDALSGRPVWIKSLGIPDNTYGHSASLLIFGGTLVVQYDQGHEPEALKSVVHAFETASGRPMWRSPRAVGSSWATPIVATTPGGPQIITASDPWVIAYAPQSGAELWRAKCLGGEVAPSPACAGGVIFVGNEGADLCAVKTDGKGDVTLTHIAWKHGDDLPDIVSPVSNGELVWTMASSGYLTCLEAGSGKVIYQQGLDAEIGWHASPVLAEGRLYLIDRSGVGHVLEAGRAFKEMSMPKLGEEVSATPALVNGRIYIRAKRNLYCIAPPAAAKEAARP